MCIIINHLFHLNPRPPLYPTMSSDSYLTSVKYDLSFSQNGSRVYWFVTLLSNSYRRGGCFEALQGRPIFYMKTFVLALRKLPVVSVWRFEKFSPLLWDKAINVHRRGAIHNSSFGSKSMFFQFFIVFIAFQYSACIKAMLVLLGSESK